jgi:hypothetical protein
VPAEVEGSELAKVDPRQLERVLILLRDKLPLVFEANRYFEERTGFHNEAGSNNLVDALSHFATLVENAEQLGPQGQAEQVALLEDHLRRSMMEAFEQLLKFRLADAAVLWEDYLEETMPLLEAGVELPGARSHDELTEKREEIAALLEVGRLSKREVSWEDWEEGTGALAEACGLTEKLLDGLEASLVAARRERRRRRRNHWIAVAILAAFLVGVALGTFLF